MSTTSEGKLATGVRIADPALWVANYADALYGYAQARITNPDQARDLVQETFLSALENLAGFEGRSSELTWLTAILKHKIIDHYRRQSARLVRNTQSMEEMDEADFFEITTGHWTAAASPGRFSSGSDMASQKELTAVLQMCMEKLPGLWLSVFTLRHMQEESSETICVHLKITPANFWVIMHRAKVSLRACIQKNWI
ncbi:MAG: sigma-70 family RNA polymerase sigma factor [Chitinophagaceae bacterium]|nr:MAG: sigma-70 family RNA polymerase sigma factor [Chitinophagaceae bacterium]